MSFSKARVQRFNECENDVPPPGAYDPKFDVKVKGSVIEKSERFHDNRSVASADYNSSLCTKSMSHVGARSRTPQLPRKKGTSRSCSKAKPCPLTLSNDKKLKYKSLHRLADLQVECSNKNETIQEHEKHIEDMKGEVKRLEWQLEEVHKRQTQIEEQHKKDIEAMAKMQQEILNGHDENHQTEIKRLRCQFLEISTENERKIEAMKAMETNFKIQTADFTRKVLALESELANERQTSKEKIHNLEIHIEELKTKMEKSIESHKNEVELLGQDKSKLESNNKNLTDALADREEELKRVIVESNAKINAMIMEAKAAVEEQMRLTTERYEACLVRVGTERAALDKKLAQKDAVIARLSATLEELKSSAETEEAFGFSLQMELDRAEAELTEKKEELKALKDQIRSEAAEMVARKKRFEVIMAENQASVVALTEHLLQSNVEVERLQHEVKRGEDCINEYRNLLNIMRSNSEMVHVQVHTLMEELDIKKGLVDQLEVKSSDVELLKSVFEAQIEDLKQRVTKQLMQLQTDCDSKDARNLKMKNQLHEMANQLNEMQNTLLKLEEKNDALEFEISRVELLNRKLNDQLKKRDTALQAANQLLEDQSTKHEAIVQEARSEVQELSDKLKCLHEKGTGIEDKTELLEEERARREAAEEEIKKLLEYTNHLKKDYQEMSEKYAELIGHQNLKQRIKHVSQLKDKINVLEQELCVKTRTIKQQHKMIEKLQADERRVPNKEKENALDSTRTILSTPVSSPQKASTPFRSRNI